MYNAGTYVGRGVQGVGVGNFILAKPDIEIIFDGRGAPIATGQKGYFVVTSDCTIDAAQLICEAGGSIVVDIWKTSYVDFDGGATHPAVGDSITGGNPLTIVAGSKAQSSLVAWSLDLLSGDILAFNVVSAANAKLAQVNLKIS